MFYDFIMQTLEFNSYVENGVIAVPSQYHSLNSRSVRVIVFPKDETPGVSQIVPGKKEIYSLAVDMSGFTFDRSEINER